MNKAIKDLIDTIKQVKNNLEFSIIEVGSLKVEDSKDPYYELLDYFPSSKIFGFEIEKETCEKMNSSARKGVSYYPFALGKTNEKRKLYITQDPRCTSLYEPNESLTHLYNGLEVSNLKKETEIETITLDSFVAKQEIKNVDFIKLDVQGAELDVLQGSKKTLKNVVKIVCEVEFIEIYKDQPLFAEVNNFLKEFDFMYNKFLGLNGRSLKPIIMNKNPYTASQHMWSDASYIYDIQKIKNLSDEKLLKLSLLASIYRSVDLAFFCLSQYDIRHSSSLKDDWLSKLK